MAECSTYSSLTDIFMQGDFVQAVRCPYENQIGTLVFGVIILGAVMMSLYIRTGSMVVPFVVAIIGGSVAVAVLPAGAMQILGLVVMIVLTVAGYWVYHNAQVAT